MLVQVFGQEDLLMVLLKQIIKKSIKFYLMNYHKIKLKIYQNYQKMKIFKSLQMKFILF